MRAPPTHPEPTTPSQNGRLLRRPGDTADRSVSLPSRAHLPFLILIPSLRHLKAVLRHRYSSLIRSPLFKPVRSLFPSFPLKARKEEGRRKSYKKNPNPRLGLEKCSKMASITASRPSAFPPSLLSRPSLPLLPYHALRRAPQEPPSLWVIQSKNAGLGLADPLLRRRRRRRGPRKREAKVEDASGQEGKPALEEEVYEFMVTSENPSFFPTREELIAAGRKDLADAIAAEGGWLAYGWNLEEEGGDGGSLDSSKSLDSSMKESLQDDERMCQQQFSSKASDGGLPCSEEFSTASSSGRSM